MNVDAFFLLSERCKSTEDLRTRGYVTCVNGNRNDVVTSPGGFQSEPWRVTVQGEPIKDPPKQQLEIASLLKASVFLFDAGSRI